MSEMFKSSFLSILLFVILSVLIGLVTDIPGFLISSILLGHIIAKKYVELDTKNEMTYSETMSIYSLFLILSLLIVGAIDRLNGKYLKDVKIVDINKTIVIDGLNVTVDRSKIIIPGEYELYKYNSFKTTHYYLKGK